ncbi:uncharacterized protein DS421_19g654130 [Arachis hypogaea]|uniref:Uncharacterized protein n=1 Tax=Arachis hypogaea TaxID=3818 RepID=A0A6B9V8E3_ARAHY|nr:uncharacterized protein DS421_19g654130 [Arachis hypogaea]
MPQVVPRRLSLDARHPPQSYSKHSRARTSLDSVRNVHRRIRCRQTPTRIPMPKGDEKENNDTVDETHINEEEVDQPDLGEDVVDQSSTDDNVVDANCSSDDMVDESSLDAHGKGYDLRIDL